MADTQRTRTAALALLADNTTQDISPQDLRDGFVTFENNFASMYIATPAATTITDTTNFFKAGGTTAEVLSDDNWTISTSNRMTFDSVIARRCLVFASFSMTSASNNVVLNFGIYHYDNSAASGSVITSSIQQRKVGTGADVGGHALFADVLMDTNDYLEFHVKNTTGATNITLQNMFMGVISRTV